MPPVLWRYNMQSQLVQLTPTQCNELMAHIGGYAKLRNHARRRMDPATNEVKRVVYVINENWKQDDWDAGGPYKGPIRSGPMARFYKHTKQDKQVSPAAAPALPAPLDLLQQIVSNHNILSQTVGIIGNHLAMYIQRWDELRLSHNELRTAHNEIVDVCNLDDETRAAINQPGFGLKDRMDDLEQKVEDRIPINIKEQMGTLHNLVPNDLTDFLLQVESRLDKLENMEDHSLDITQMKEHIHDMRGDIRHLEQQ